MCAMESSYTAEFKMSVGHVESVNSPSDSHATGGSLGPPEEHDNPFGNIPDLLRNVNTFPEVQHTVFAIEDALLPHMAELEARAAVKFDNVIKPPTSEQLIRIPTIEEAFEDSTSEAFAKPYNSRGDQITHTKEAGRMTFIKEEFYHNFFPLSIPFMYFLDGKKWALINRGFMGWDHLPLAIYQWFFALNFYMLNVVSLAYAYKAKNLEFLYDVALIDFLWFMRNMVVATKYAFLPKIEREEMKTGFVPNDVQNYRTVSSRTTLKVLFTSCKSLIRVVKVLNALSLSSQRRLLSAWKDPIPSRVLKNELLLASVRNKQAFRNSYFLLDSSIESSRAISDLILDLRLMTRSAESKYGWDKLADLWLEAGRQEHTTESSLQEEGVIGSLQHLPVRLYAAHVIHQSSSLRRLKRIGHGLLSQHMIPCAFTLGVAHSVLLTVGRFAIGGHQMPGPTWTVYCIVIPGFVLMAFSMFSNIGFMMVGVLDFRRRHFIAQNLDELLRTSIYTGSHNVRPVSSRSTRFRLFSSTRSAGSYEVTSSRSSSSGKLSGDGICFDFQDPESLLAWWTCRQLMQNFGLGFYKRIKYYTTYFAGYCGVLLLFVVLKMLTGIKRDDMYLIITVLFSIIVFLTLLALMVWPGGDTNNMLQHHGDTLTSRKIKTHTKTIMGSNSMATAESNETRIVLRTMTSISEAIKWDNMKSKLSVCGFEARDQLVSVIVAVVAATMSIGIGQIVQNGFAV